MGENKWESVVDSRLSKEVLNTTIKSQSIKTKVGEFEFIKFLILLFKRLLTEWKFKSKARENIWKVHIRQRTCI